MDPITHTLAGATLARAGLDRRTPLALATLIIAANAPDIDILSLYAGRYATLALRRGWTHGPIAMVVLPWLVAAGVLAWDRWVRAPRNPSREPARAGAVLMLAIIGVVSHPLLDWMNTYGVRLLSPFSSRWFHGDALFIIDPWLWLVLGGGLALARRRRADPARAIRMVRVAGAGAVAYIIALVAMSAAGERMARTAADAHGITDIVRVLYEPAPGNPLAADLLVATTGGYRFGRLRWTAGERVQFFDDRIIARGDWSAPAVARALTYTEVRRYMTWSQFPYVYTEPDVSGGVAVYFGDARFVGGPAGGGLQGVRVVVENTPR
jgi:inner membrane protein